MYCFIYFSDVCYTWAGIKWWNNHHVLILLTYFKWSSWFFFVFFFPNLDKTFNSSCQIHEHQYYFLLAIYLYHNETIQECLYVCMNYSKCSSLIMETIFSFKVKNKYEIKLFFNTLFCKQSMFALEIISNFRAPFHVFP